MPIYLAEELPDLPEYSAINRAVPQMPSGMEKEEESVGKFFGRRHIGLKTRPSRCDNFRRFKCLAL